jgi:hypothetical protein
MAPTTSPAPTIATIAVLVNIHLDRYANEVAWNLVETDTGIVILDVPFETYLYENDVTVKVLLRPETNYNFTISDLYGDGLVNKGFYRIITEDETLMLVMGDGSHGRERTHVFQTPAMDFSDAALQSSYPSDVPSSIPSGPPSLIPSSPPTTTASDSPSYTPTEMDKEVVVVGPPTGIDGTTIVATCLFGESACLLDSDCCSRSCEGGVCAPGGSSDPDGRLDDGKIKEPGGTEYRPPRPLV